MEKIVCIIILILYGVVMLLMCYIAIFQKEKEPKNKVHFYVARDMNGELWFYITKPFRGDEKFFGRINIPLSPNKFNYLGLNENDYDNLTWEEEPVEVFLNLED